MGAVVTFDYDAWKARYPEFASTSQQQAQAFFNEACLYWDNTGAGPVWNPTIQLLYLNMLTAHIAQLYVQSSTGVQPGQPSESGAPVGRIASATQGSVSISTEMNVPTSGTNQAWFLQTKYGAQFWSSTAQYRTMRYRLGTGPSANGGYPPVDAGLGAYGYGYWGRGRY